jgi:hypothetical protein
MDIRVNNSVKYLLSIMVIALAKFSGLYCIIYHNEAESNNKPANVGVFWMGWWWESSEVKEARRKEGEAIVHHYFKKWTPYEPKITVESVRLDLSKEI